MLKLITFAPCLGLRSPSPFTVKADALLAMSGLDYEYESGDVRKMPKAKLPVLRDGEKLIPDSAHIQTYLETEKNITFDHHLTPQQKAVDTAYRRLIEHHLYFINAHFRWMESGEEIRDPLFAQVPRFIRGFVFNMVKKKVKQNLYGQGLGRHSRRELIEFGVQDITALATQLGDNDFFHGDKPSSIDAALYGVLHTLLACTIDSPIKQEAQKHNNLAAFCARFEEQFFKNKPL